MVTQRMRWIKPGEFMMGSPESEVDRNKNETLHRVTLTQGYWMADTQVTQELWMAIGRGENPSAFKGESNPVEHVSWEDCQAWFEKLCEHHESLQLSLPPTIVTDRGAVGVCMPSWFNGFVLLW
ncbi:MAG: SUMF1/EgtB/PvdO family nonheme iron enzyme [Planctomycetota bacterium]|nr:SUMF1/EgtB/PvdO family nonheme iron enzyme [Planctomycetota bacterium]